MWFVKAEGDCVSKKSKWSVVHLGERVSKNRDVSNACDSVEAVDELDTNGGNLFFKVVFGSNKAV